MDKKTAAVTVMTFLILGFIVAIGATLSAFKVAKDRVIVEGINILSAPGIKILDSKGNEVSELEVKSSSVGVRPATGEEDIETNIPTTVNDAVGTEGAYTCFKLTSDSAWEIRLVDCSLSAGMEENLDNVRIGVMEEKNDPISGADKGVVLARGEAVTDKEIVVVVWLDAEATKSIKGAKINIQIEAVTK